MKTRLLSEVSSSSLMANSSSISSSTSSSSRGFIGDGEKGVFSIHSSSPSIVFAINPFTSSKSSNSSNFSSCMKPSSNGSGGGI